MFGNFNAKILHIQLDEDEIRLEPRNIQHGLKRSFPVEQMQDEVHCKAIEKELQEIEAAKNKRNLGLPPPTKMKSYITSARDVPQKLYKPLHLESEEPQTNASKEQKNDTPTKKQYKDVLFDFKVFTGSIEKVIKWHKLYKEMCFYEVIGPLVAMQNGQYPQEKILLLRDKRGPVLQVCFWEFEDRKLPQINPGCQIRCVGRMINANKLQCEFLRTACDDEVAALARLSFICEHAVTKAVAK